MDFEAVILFTQQVYHLQCLQPFDSFCYLRLILFRIKSQPSVAYQNVTYKKSM